MTSTTEFVSKHACGDIVYAAEIDGKAYGDVRFVAYATYRNAPPAIVLGTGANYDHYLFVQPVQPEDPITPTPAQNKALMFDTPPPVGA